MQTADCRPDTKCRLGTNCRLQTRCKTQTENLYCCFVWYVITSYIWPSVTHSLFPDHLTRLFALLWNISCPFLDHKRNFKFSYSILTLRVSWSVWCLYRIYQLNESRRRCKGDATIEYLTCAIFEKELPALHVLHTFHLFTRYVFISTRFIFNVQRCTHTDFHLCALYCYWLT